MSNGVEFDGTKEDYMQKLNPFIKKNRLFVDIFFDTLTVCIIFISNINYEYIILIILL